MDLTVTVVEVAVLSEQFVSSESVYSLFVVVEDNQNDFAARRACDAESASATDGIPSLQEHGNVCSWNTTARLNCYMDEHQRGAERRRVATT